MIKKSKVTNVQGGGTWSPKDNPDKIFYGFEVEMENGDIGQYSSIKQDQDKFVVGQEVEYEFTGGKFPKVKPVYQKSGFGGFKEDPNRQKLIIRQSSLRSAVEYLKGAEASLEEVFEAAEKMINWVNDKPNNSDNNDLPF